MKLLFIDLRLLLVDKESYKLHDIDQGYELLQFFEDNKLKFWKGCAFYEFVRKSEDIHKESEVILIDKVRFKVYTVAYLGL